MENVWVRWKKFDDQNIWKLSVSGYQIVGLNGDMGLLRMHWASRKHYQDTITAMMSAPGLPPSLTAPIEIVVCRAYKGRPMDEDNLAASAKPVLDALKKLRVIPDDGPNVIKFSATQRKRKELGCDWEVVVAKS